MSGSERKPTPRAVSATPNVLREQLLAALRAEGGERAPALHALVDGAFHHLLTAAVRGDGVAVNALADVVRSAADEVPNLDISAADAARYRLAVLPRLVEVVERIVPGSALGLTLRAPEGATAREVLAVLAEESTGSRCFLRAGEVRARGDFDVGERRVGQVLDELLAAGWLVQVVRNTPGPARHYALSPVGAERVAALGISRRAKEAARSGLFERYERLPYSTPSNATQHNQRPRRSRLTVGSHVGSPFPAHGFGMPS